MKQRTSKKEVKSYVVVVKLAPSLIGRIDASAEAEGLTRSAIIRRALMKKYAA